MKGNAFRSLRGSSEAGPKNEPTISDVDTYDLVSTPKVFYEVAGRWRRLNKTNIEFEVWVSYQPKSGKGRGGRAVSVRTGRCVISYMDLNNKKVFVRHGKLERWWFNGKRRTVSKMSAGTAVMNAEFDTYGRLFNFTDSGRADGIERHIIYRFDKEIRTVEEWRGRFSHKYRGTGYPYEGQYCIKRNENGLPLKEDGDYMLREYFGDGKLNSEQPFVAGKEHGFFRRYNKFGRVIFESYYYKGVEIPDWVYLDPKQVTVEEVESEENDTIREFMLKEQGELFQIRMMARGMKAVMRARLTEEPTLPEDSGAIKRATPEKTNA